MKECRKESNAAVRNWVACLDGTWDGECKDTNVHRLWLMLGGDAGSHGTAAYFPGVGTRRREWLRGALFGKGLAQQVKDAYAWLGARWREGDRIWLFGFSRGAYAARVLAGLIGLRGFPPDLRSGTRAKRLAAAAREYEGYRAKEAGAGVDVHFVGVFDTVGSLGIPELRRVRKLFALPRFHDTLPGPHLLHGRHAVAMDERRVPFLPTLWSDADGRPIAVLKKPGRSIKQVWFRGVHSDVGGQSDRRTNDIALGWMMDEAAALGLVFQPGARKGVRGDASAPLCRGGKPWYDRVLKKVPRAVPEVRCGAADIHPSVLVRRKKEGDPWSGEPADSDGWTSVPGGCGAVCTGLWLPGGSTVRLHGEFGEKRMWGFAANGVNPPPGRGWGGHQEVPLDGTPVTLARGGYLWVSANRHAASGILGNGKGIPCGRVRVEWGAQDKP